MIWQHKMMIFIILTVSTGFFISLSLSLKKKYQSDFTINIYSKYFNNPLTGQAIAGVYNLPEMRETVKSMIFESLNDDFYDELAQEFDIYSMDGSELEVAKSRSFLKDRLSVYSVGGSAFKAKFIDGDPFVARDVANKILQHIIQHFIQSKIKTITITREAMIKRLNSFKMIQKVGDQNGQTNPLAAKSPNILLSELKGLQGQIAALKKQYNTIHPKIQRLIKRKNTVEGWLKEFKNFPKINKSADDLPVLFEHNNEEAVKLAAKLFSDYSNINIALELERKSVEDYIGVIRAPELPIAPLWPQKRLFASVGLLVGMIFAFLYVLIKEIMVPGESELIKTSAAQIGTEFLGTFPCIPLVSISRRPTAPSIVSDQSIHHG